MVRFDLWLVNRERVVFVGKLQSLANGASPFKQVMDARGY
jgi:hypothetical protein